MGSLSPAHWLVILVVVLLIFGPGKLADAGRGLGEGIRNLKKGLAEGASDDSKPKPPAPAENKTDKPS